MGPALAFLIAGVVLLTVGADRFVVAAARLARAWGLSPVVVGALVIGLGTSAPELLVSTVGAMRGQIDLAVGNVVGSNTANVTLVLGCAALLTPIASRLEVIRREGVVMLAASGVLAFVLWDLKLSRLEAGALLLGMAIAAIALILWARSDEAAGRRPDLAHSPWEGRASREALVAVITLVMTLAGADLLVRGATRLAAAAGISSTFVGLVVVAVGTSLPELATSLAAARRGETDLVLGNVLGSNLFNALAVTGTAGLIRPGAIGAEFRPAIVFMLVSAMVAGTFAASGRRLERWESGVLLGAFAVFVAAIA
jgi:cation:H+ antiporter